MVCRFDTTNSKDRDYRVKGERENQTGSDIQTQQLVFMKDSSSPILQPEISLGDLKEVFT